jgi:hypothetical protein
LNSGPDYEGVDYQPFSETYESPEYEPMTDKLFGKPDESVFSAPTVKETGIGENLIKPSENILTWNKPSGVKPWTRSIPAKKEEVKQKIKEPGMVINR